MESNQVSVIYCEVDGTRTQTHKEQLLRQLTIQFRLSRYDCYSLFMSETGEQMSKNVLSN